MHYLFDLVTFVVSLVVVATSTGLGASLSGINMDDLGAGWPMALWGLFGGAAVSTVNFGAIALWKGLDAASMFTQVLQGFVAVNTLMLPWWIAFGQAIGEGPVEDPGVANYVVLYVSTAITLALVIVACLECKGLELEDRQCEDPTTRIQCFQSPWVRWIWFAELVIVPWLTMIDYASEDTNVGNTSFTLAAQVLYGVIATTITTGALIISVDWPQTIIQFGFAVWAVPVFVLGTVTAEHSDLEPDLAYGLYTGFLGAISLSYALYRLPVYLAGMCQGTQGGAFPDVTGAAV